MKKRTMKKLLALITMLALLLTTFGTVLSAQETTEEIVAWVDSDDDGVIDEGENTYATLMDALEGGETDITLAKDHATDVTITVFTDGTVIDLGGHTLSTSEAFVDVDMINFQTDYSLTLKNGNIETAHDGDSIIWHNTDAALTLDGITLTSSGTLSSADIWHTAGTLELIDSSVGIIYVYAGTKVTLSGDVSVDEWSIGAEAVFNVDPSLLNGFDKGSYEAVKSEESGLWIVKSKNSEPDPEEIVAWVDSDDDGVIDEEENGYATLIDALDVGETDITLAKDHATDVTITVFTDGTVIDLGGHTLSTSEAFGGVDMINFHNDYSLTLKNGNIETAYDGDSIIWHNADAALTLDGITITSSGTLSAADIYNLNGTLELIDSTVGLIYVYEGVTTMLSGDVSVDEWSISVGAIFNVDPTGLNGFDKELYEAEQSEESGLWTVISKPTEPESEEIVAWGDSDNDAVIDEGENTYATLYAALNGGETNIKLAKDHAIDGPLIIRTNGTIIDLCDYTLSTADLFNGTDMIGFNGDYNLIIKNGTIESNHDGDSVIWHGVSSTLTLYDVTITSRSALIYGAIYHASGALELTDITVDSIYVCDTASTMLNGDVSVDVWGIDIGTQFNVDPTDFNGFDKANLIAVKNPERELWEIYDINEYINSAFSLQTLEGASVRISKTKSGLRFKTQIYADDIADLVAIFGADNVQIGTLIAPSDKLSGTLTFEFGTSGVDYIDVVADYTLPFSSENGSNVYAGSITSIKPANLSRNFTAIGYVKITHNGSIFYLYSPSAATRSVSDVANAALTDFSDVEQGDYVNEIYTDMWSAYTPEERKMLAELIPAVYTQEEFSAAKDKDGYIKLGADITISDHSTVSINTFIILDLSGFDLTLTGESAFYLNDTMIICGEGKIHSEDYYAFFHGNGTMKLVGNAATISGAYESPIYWVSGGNIDLRDFTGESFVIEPAEDMPVDAILLPDGWKLYNADNNEVTTAIKWNVITAKPAISE